MFWGLGFLGRDIFTFRGLIFVSCATRCLTHHFGFVVSPAAFSFNWGCASLGTYLKRVSDLALKRSLFSEAEKI